MAMTPTRLLGGIGVVVATLAGCNPNTSRPAFLPLPAAATAELELPVAVAVDVIAEALRKDSIPVAETNVRDGYLESGWFLAQDGTPTSRRPLGVEVVRVRGWVTPGRVGHTDIQVETVYRPMADPSRPERELDRLVPPDHPVARRLEGTLARLVTEFGHPEALAPPPAPAAIPDTILTKSPPVKPDTTVKPDTIPRGPRRQVP
ncbi:MAG: hypothetical protein SGI84_09535 [Gemmatimonadota bacterium]|nr:hypothetical protein [Gemmatimonadota bacterium]